MVASLEEDSSLLLELEDSTELLEDFESLDFAELEEGTELEDEATELLDLAELEDEAIELLDFAELEDTTTLELDCTAELLDFAELEDTFDEDEISSIATTLILPVTVFVFS